MKKAIRKSNRGESLVGSGVGRRHVERISWTEFPTSGKHGGRGFDRFTRAAEGWARETLERARLPVAQGLYHLPDGKPLLPEEVAALRIGLESLRAGKRPVRAYLPGEHGYRMDVVKARGFREFESDEWRAAAILDNLEWIRSCRKRGDVDGALFYAARVGGLFREARIRDLFKEDSRSRARVPERDPVIERWVSMRLRTNHRLTFTDLRDELKPTRDGEEEIRVGKAKLYLDGGRIRISKGATEVGDLSLESLRRYLTEAKKQRKSR